MQKNTHLHFGDFINPFIIRDSADDNSCLSIITLFLHVTNLSIKRKVSIQAKSKESFSATKYSKTPMSNGIIVILM